MPRVSEAAAMPLPRMTVSLAASLVPRSALLARPSAPFQVPRALTAAHCALRELFPLLFPPIRTIFIIRALALDADESAATKSHSIMRGNSLQRQKKCVSLCSAPSDSRCTSLIPTANGENATNKSHPFFSLSRNFMSIFSRRSALV